MAIDERELDDAFLVEAAQQGDADAFSELFRRHYPTVRRVCARRFGSAAEADEVAQAAFVRAYERIDQCVGERRFGAWVQVIAYRLGADARRSRARSLLTDEPVGGDAALGPNHCEDALLRSEQAAAVHEVLASLPPRQREVIVARDLEGQRPGEIAASLGLSLGAVDSLLLRARRRMAIAWRAGRPDTGLVSPHVAGASLAATSAAATVTDSGSLRLLSRLSDAIARASFHLANGLGVLPGATTTLPQRLGGLAVAGAIAAAPVLTVLPAPPTAAGPSPAARHASATRPVSTIPLVNPTALLPAAPLIPAPVRLPALIAPPVTTPPVAMPPVTMPTVTGPGVTLPSTGVVAGSPDQVAAGLTTAVSGVHTTVTGVVATVTSTVTGVSQHNPSAPPPTGLVPPAVTGVTSIVGGATTAAQGAGQTVTHVVGALGVKP